MVACDRSRCVWTHRSGCGRYKARPGRSSSSPSFPESLHDCMKSSPLREEMSVNRLTLVSIQRKAAPALTPVTFSSRGLAKASATDVEQSTVAESHRHTPGAGCGRRCGSVGWQIVPLPIDMWALSPCAIVRWSRGRWTSLEANFLERCPCSVEPLTGQREVPEARHTVLQGGPPGAKRRHSVLLAVRGDTAGQLSSSRPKQAAKRR
jgi:hypothetical protein